tara:strand:+ start:372 stop:2204 length:1833 start_codon:yes stop_codon:yes gene_type:complete
MYCAVTAQRSLQYARPQLAARRWFAAAALTEAERVSNLRNFGISAHIDSGKTTLTERILFYTGRIGAIHEVRGKDGVGAKMDSMDLEREKGITIQSAATYAEWGDKHLNIIDTPGHVDFTVEVERALRVLDGAILVLCAVSGVQSQSITVDRQMKRYDVPRLAFINKLDREGANPERVVGDLRSKLKLNAVLAQLPIGLEKELEGVVDLVEMKAYYFDGDSGERLRTEEVPADMLERATTAREELVDALADVDEEIGELFLMEEVPTTEQVHAAIRRATIALELVPVFVGSAFKNKGVQPLMDAVVNYLPAPCDRNITALDTKNDEVPVALVPESDKPLVALAFKLEEGRYGQLTYMRVYQGELTRGKTVHNLTDRKKIKVPRLARMHSAEMEDVEAAGAGEIVAMFGVDCRSGDTFTDDPALGLAMSSMFVPEPVMSLSCIPKASKDSGNFTKALTRFGKEDPTFRYHVDSESKQTIIAGMGELHLEVYVERMLREYELEVTTGPPQVNYRETIRARADFDYLHRKQTGGSGQYGKISGFIEPLEEGSDKDFEVRPRTQDFSFPSLSLSLSLSSFRLQRLQLLSSLTTRNRSPRDGVIPAWWIMLSMLP